jgi:YfiH family protein
LTSPGDRTPCHRFTEWEAVRPGIVAGITAVSDAQGSGSESDFGLATGGTAWDVTRRYEELARATGMRSAAVARQVHGTRILEVNSSPGRGVFVVGEADGLMTSVPGVLLAVTAADCVPAFVVDVGGRCVALLHAGWRGVAAGILELAVEAIGRRFGADSGALAVYLGPAICGVCYEVGGEVLQAFGMEGSRPSGLDLRSELEVRAVEAGVPANRIERSEWCTGGRIKGCVKSEATYLSAEH